MFKKKSDFKSASLPVLSAAEAKELGLDQVKSLKITNNEEGRQGSVTRYDVWDYNLADGQNSVTLALVNIPGTVVTTFVIKDAHGYTGWNLVSIFART